MEWHVGLLMNSQIDEVVVVAGHLGDQVQTLCAAIDHQGLKIRVLHEEQQEGTVAALRLAAESADADEFVVILGDILMALPLQDFLDEWRLSGAGVAVVVHPSAHPHDSDAVFPKDETQVLVVPKSESRDHIPNMSSAGLFAMTKEALSRYGYLRDIGSDVLPAAAAHRDVFAFVSSHYLKDTGTFDRLDAARRDVSTGAFARRGSLSPRPALFLDRDGVINPALPEFHDPEGYVLLPGVGQAIGAANSLGVPVIVVTNQPALAKGLMTFEAHQRVRARMDNLLGDEGAFVDDYLFCPHHPEVGWVGEVEHMKVACQCRKPATGLAHEAAQHHNLNLVRSVMVGDTDRDRGFARGSGMRFIHVSAPHNDTDAEDCIPDAAVAIRRGIEVVTC